MRAFAFYFVSKLFFALAARRAPFTLSRGPSGGACRKITLSRARVGFLVWRPSAQITPNARVCFPFCFEVVFRARGPQGPHSEPKSPIARPFLLSMLKNSACANHPECAGLLSILFRICFSRWRPAGPPFTLSRGPSGGACRKIIISRARVGFLVWCPRAQITPNARFFFELVFSCSRPAGPPFRT